MQELDQLVNGFSEQMRALVEKVKKTRTMISHDDLDTIILVSKKSPCPVISLDWRQVVGICEQAKKAIEASAIVDRLKEFAPDMHDRIVAEVEAKRQAEAAAKAEAGDDESDEENENDD